MNIRDATEADLPAIVAIYNASIPSRTATADLEPIAVESRRGWFAQFGGSRPIWVLEIEDEIAAWISLSSFYGGRPAYDATAEVSIYIDPQHQRKGYGTMLIQRMIEHCPQLGVTTLLAMYFDHNQASQKTLTAIGFEPTGHLREIAVLDGVKRGLIIAARRIDL